MHIYDDLVYQEPNANSKIKKFQIEYSSNKEKFLTEILTEVIKTCGQGEFEIENLNFMTIEYEY